MQDRRPDSEQETDSYLAEDGAGSSASHACLIAQIASLVETRLGQRFIFRCFDSLPVHDANVEAPRPIARIAGVFENLPGLEHVLGNAFPEKITFPELSAAARKSGRTALLEEGRRILEVTADSLAPVIERPEHETARSVSTATGLQQYAVSVGFHHIHKTAASALQADIAGVLKTPGRADRIAGKPFAATQQHSQIEATAERSCAGTATSRVRARTWQAFVRPASQAFAQNAGSLPGCFPPR